jgi:hypothetical protein
MQKIKQISLLGLLLICGNLVHSQWISDPLLNNPICTDTNAQYAPVICSDNAGGAIIVWQDRRNGPASFINIYAQRINAFGNVLWDVNGIAVCDHSYEKASPKVIADGSGGAIIIWEDWRGTDENIYAQKINGSGISQWTANGVLVCPAVGEQHQTALVPDGHGGAFITWHDQRYDSFGEVYAQKINNNGIKEWYYNGVPITFEVSAQAQPSIIADGAGGAIISWIDFRSETQYDIYAQKLDSSGINQWIHNGKPVCLEAENKYLPVICSDGFGGALITWMDKRNGLEDIYAQRINSSGLWLWDTTGIAICNLPNQQFYPSIIPDGWGGALIAWNDFRNGINTNAYAQRINSSGNTLWSLNGNPVSSSSLDQEIFDMVSDNQGGIIIAWEAFDGIERNLYAQRIGPIGTPYWGTTGSDICIQTDNQYYPMIVSDGYDGAIITWEDHRSGNNADIYAQNISGAGIIGGVISVPSISNFSEVINIFPNPSNGVFNINMNDASGEEEIATIHIYNSLGENIYTNEYFVFDLSNKMDISQYGNGMYFLEIKKGGDIFVEKIVVQ